MKKDGLLSLLGQLKAESEQKPGEELETMPLRLLDLLLDYVNDPQIRAAVDEIHF